MRENKKRDFTRTHADKSHHERYGQADIRQYVDRTTAGAADYSLISVRILTESYAVSQWQPSKTTLYWSTLAGMSKDLLNKP